jgi:hypothetical protein
VKIPDKTRQWLLDSPYPRVRYQANLLFSPERADRKELLTDPLVIELVESLKSWDTEVLKRHNAATLGIHRLALLADLGVRADDPPVKPIVETVFRHVDDRGIPLVRMEIPTVFGGTGKPEWSWMACDFPTILYAFIKMGVAAARVESPLQELIQLIEEDGLHCHGSNPKFHGPGKRSDFCPYADLLAAKILALNQTTASSAAARHAVQALLRHWDQRGKKRYFLFGIGTDFQKLKFPLVWYNLLHVLEAVSRYKAFREDSRVKAMAGVLEAKADDQGRFTAESMYRAYKAHDFADKKQPSPTLTVVILKILERIACTD